MWMKLCQSNREDSDQAMPVSPSLLLKGERRVFDLRNQETARSDAGVTRHIRAGSNDKTRQLVRQTTVLETSVRSLRQ